MCFLKGLFRFVLFGESNIKAERKQVTIFTDVKNILIKVDSVSAAISKLNSDTKARLTDIEDKISLLQTVVDVKLSGLQLDLDSRLQEIRTLEMEIKTIEQTIEDEVSPSPPIRIAFFNDAGEEIKTMENKSVDSAFKIKAGGVDKFGNFAELDAPAILSANDPALGALVDNGDGTGEFTPSGKLGVVSFHGDGSIRGVALPQGDLDIGLVAGDAVEIDVALA